MSDNRKSGPPARRVAGGQTIIPPRNCVTELQRILGPVVLLHCAGKRPVAKGWQRLTLADMSPGYLTKLTRGNIGISLGQPSGGLCVVDIDSDQFVEPFLASNPQFADTLQTVGRRGRVFWFRVKGECPPSKQLKAVSGEAVGEFRSNGNQSIIAGIHPDTKKPYRWVVAKPVVEIELASIKWPDSLANPFVPSIGKLPVGELLNGDVSKGASLLSMLGVGGGVGGVALIGSRISEKARAEIEQAVKFGAESTRQNNAAAFQACVALLRLQGGDNLHHLTPAERRHFAERWFLHLQSLNRITPGKTRTHYLNDIVNAIKNAKASDQTRNPVPHAILLAQNNPLPAEAAMFDGDLVMQRLIGVCFQLHKLSGGGEWFVSRDKLGKMMELDATATRDLSINFSVLVEFGILKIVRPYDKAKRQATTYRYVEQLPEETA